MKQVYCNSDETAGSSAVLEQVNKESQMDPVIQIKTDIMPQSTIEKKESDGITGAGNKQKGNINDQINCDWNGNAAGFQTLQGGKGVKPDTEYTRNLKDNFGFFGITSLIYALFYTFCMYRNSSGITYPFFAAGSLLFFCFCLTRLGISLKKGSVFYMTGILLLAVSTFSTDDGRIIILNKIGIFLLLISLLLRQLYNTSSWKLGRYLLNIFTTVFASIGEIARPFQDMAGFYKTRMKGRQRKALYVIIGAAFAAPLFLIIFSLLASADAVFRDMTRKMTQSLEIGTIFHMVFMTAFMFFAVYCILSFLCKKTLPEEVKDKRNGEPLIAITITLILSVLYLLFCAVQIIYLFGGRMQLPEGYTYAEYAREGFFQLLFVSILNLIIVLTCMSFFKKSLLLKWILTVMSLCTFIMMASSAMRMIIYIQYYYLTFLRIFVLWSLFVLFLLFAGVVTGIFREKFPLFRYGISAVTVCFLILSFSHPDYWIARINLSNTDANMKHPFFQGEIYQDYYYLATLNLDAAPVILPFLQEKGYSLDQSEQNTQQNPSTDNRTQSKNEVPEDIILMGNRYLYKLSQRTENVTIRSFNTSRYLAGEKLASMKGN